MRRSIIWSLLVVFISGLIIGMMAGQFVFHFRFERAVREGPRGIEQYFLRQLTKKLQLRDEQVPAVEEKLKATVAVIDARRRKSLEELDAILNSMLKEMQPLLDADQQRLLSAMDARDFRPKHPPPPPPAIVENASPNDG